MNVRLHQICLATTATVVAGAWAWLSFSLRENGRLDLTPNIAAIGMSPYGKTLGLVVQSPIDAYWHAGEDCDHDDGCPECQHRHAGEAGEAGHGPLLGRAKDFVSGLERCVQARNNPHGQTQAHKRYLRRQIEDKLATAYWLDPANYANYNSYHLFLTESALGTREHTLDDVIALCDRTRSCIEREKINPEPWLTAASALVNKMELVFLHRDQLPDARGLMLRSAADLEASLNRFTFLRDCQKAAGLWDQVAEPRRDVMEQRFKMLGRLLEAQKVILNERFPATPNGGQPG